MNAQQRKVMTDGDSETKSLKPARLSGPGLTGFPRTLGFGSKPSIKARCLPVTVQHSNSTAAEYGSATSALNPSRLHIARDDFARTTPKARRTPVGMATAGVVPGSPLFNRRPGSQHYSRSFCSIARSIACFNCCAPSGFNRYATQPRSSACLRKVSSCEPVINTIGNVKPQDAR